MGHLYHVLREAILGRAPLEQHHQVACSSFDAFPLKVDSYFRFVACQRDQSLYESLGDGGAGGERLLAGAGLLRRPSAAGKSLLFLYSAKQALHAGGGTPIDNENCPFKFAEAGGEAGPDARSGPEQNAGQRAYLGSQ